MRADGRGSGELRPLRIERDYTGAPAGSALIRTGGTLVLCTASVEDGAPPFKRDTGEGWLTAEYAMLPGSTRPRKPREYDKRDGRSVEIGRLIGRALRACADLSRMPGKTIRIDCDVLQADGGTRTASINGAFVALCAAVDRELREGRLLDSPIVSQLAAVGVGLSSGAAIADLDYAEDSGAQADMTLALSRSAGAGFRFVEIQGTGEGRPFGREELDRMIAVGETAIEAIMEAQRTALGPAARVIGKKPTLLIASGNAHKIRELRALLGERFDAIPMGEAGVSELAEETGETFEANARIKAEDLSKRTGAAAVADDSGLEVDALGGRPGVYSARYAGTHGDDGANNRLLLRELSDASGPRTARYACAVALARPGRSTAVATGRCEGIILREPDGEGGFGYDPLFYSSDLEKTFARATPEEKDAVSHRGRAIRALLERLG